MTDEKIISNILFSKSKEQSSHVCDRDVRKGNWGDILNMASFVSNNYTSVSQI